MLKSILWVMIWNTRRVCVRSRRGAENAIPPRRVYNARNHLIITSCLFDYFHANSISGIDALFARFRPIFWRYTADSYLYYLFFKGLDQVSS